MILQKAHFDNRCQEFDCESSIFSLILIIIHSDSLKEIFSLYSARLKILWKHDKIKSCKWYDNSSCLCIKEYIVEFLWEDNSLILHDDTELKESD